MITNFMSNKEMFRKINIGFLPNMLRLIIFI